MKFQKKIKFDKLTIIEISIMYVKRFRNTSRFK